jgi:CheY-like chemotaxis protein
LQAWLTQENVVTHSHRVLAVEDDADTLQLMRLVLRDLPVEIIQAGTGAEAIAYLEGEAPELMFLDINLPDMHGWEVLDRFKNDTRLNVTRVIVLTSHSDPVHRLIGMLQPIAAYLTKPIAADQLRQQVRDLLALP